MPTRAPTHPPTPAPAHPPTPTHAADPIFLAAPAPASGGFLAINRRGQALLGTVNEAAVVPFVSGQLQVRRQGTPKRRLCVGRGCGGRGGGGACCCAQGEAAFALRLPRRTNPLPLLALPRPAPPPPTRTWSSLWRWPSAATCLGLRTWWCSASSSCTAGGSTRRPQSWRRGPPRARCATRRPSRRSSASPRRWAWVGWEWVGRVWVGWGGRVFGARHAASPRSNPSLTLTPCPPPSTPPCHPHSPARPPPCWCTLAPSSPNPRSTPMRAWS